MNGNAILFSMLHHLESVNANRNEIEIKFQHLINILFVIRILYTHILTTRIEKKRI